MPDSHHWRVLIAVPAEYVGPLRTALPQVIDGERHALITEVRPDGSDGDTTLWLDVVAQDPQEAEEAAAETLGASFATAGIRGVPDRTELLGMWPPAFVESPWHTLCQEAGLPLDEGQFDFAVVRAQTSLELYVTAALDEVCRHRFGGAGPLIAKHLRATLRDDRTQDVLEALVGERPNAQEWWKSFAVHLQRRHAIVHDGVEVTEHQAEESLKAVDECRKWMLSLWGPVGT